MSSHALPAHAGVPGALGGFGISGTKPTSSSVQTAAGVNTDLFRMVGTKLSIVHAPMNENTFLVVPTNLPKGMSFSDEVIGTPFGYAPDMQHRDRTTAHVRRGWDGAQPSWQDKNKPDYLKEKITVTPACGSSRVLRITSEGSLGQVAGNAVAGLFGGSAKHPPGWSDTTITFIGEDCPVADGTADDIIAWMWQEYYRLNGIAGPPAPSIAAAPVYVAPLAPQKPVEHVTTTPPANRFSGGYPLTGVNGTIDFRALSEVDYEVVGYYKYSDGRKVDFHDRFVGPAGTTFQVERQVLTEVGTGKKVTTELFFTLRDLKYGEGVIAFNQDSFLGKQ
ncbi:MAG: hypothetical protein WCO52_03230 [bacterium]